MIKSKKNILSKGTSIKFIAVTDELPLYKIRAKFSKYKYNIVYVVQEHNIKAYSESAIEKLMLKYGSTTTIRQIQVNLLD